MKVAVDPAPTERFAGWAVMIGAALTVSSAPVLVTGPPMPLLRVTV